MESNAKRAAGDPRAIAYVGELELGGSAVSLPVTNRAGLLQVSPADGLTSLTEAPPGRPRAGPERYYPERRRTFARTVAPDVDAAREMLRRLPSGEVAILFTGGIAERELAGILAYTLRRRGRPPLLVKRVENEPGKRVGLLDELAERRPAALLVAGAPGTPTAALLGQLADRLPGATVVGSPPLAALAGTRALPDRAIAVTNVLPSRPKSPRPGARYGHRAMKLVLEAIEAGGSDRAAVVREALRLGRASGPRELAVVDLTRDRVSVLERSR